MTHAEIQALVHEFILSRFPAARTAGVGVEDELLESGIVDSMGVMEILLFVEERFGVALEDEEMIPENFHTIPALSELIHRKRGVAAA